MAKLVIGKTAPKSFPLKVEIPTSNGVDEVNFEARHLSSTEWAKMREAHSEQIAKDVQALFDAARAEAEKAFAADAKKAKAKLDADAKESAILALLKPVKDSDIAELRARHGASMIQQLVTSWDLDFPLELPVLVDMCDSYPGSAEAIFKAYNETREGQRAKN